MLSVEQVKTDVAPWLAPISEGEPAGQNSMFDPRYEALRGKMVALDSPTGAEIEWPDVVASGRELLTTATKDLLIASYTTYALLETGNLEGLAVGVGMLRGLLETYWDTMFPPAKRLRGRGNALDWLVARLEVALPRLEIKPADRPAVELVQSQWSQLSGAARERLGEHCPAMRGVEDALARILMSLPAPESAASATPPPAPVAAPPPAAQAPPGPQAAPQPPPSPATNPGAATPPPAPAAGSASTAGTDAPATPKANPLDAARQAAAAWLEPISDAQPAGADPRYEEEYQAARTEVGKLDSPTTDLPQWDTVEKLSDTVLKTKGKDALMAGYLAFSMYQDKGLSHLPAGLMVVTGLVDRFHDTMFPTRPRGRSNALGWFVEQLDEALGQEKLTPQQRDTVLQVDAAIKEMSGVLRDKMGEHAPGLTPLRDRMQRMLLAVPDKKPEPPPAPRPTAAPAHRSAATTTAKPASAMPAAGDVGSAEEVSKFLLATGQAVTKAATVLRAADAGNATAYRLLRTGLWLHLVAPPPAGPGGKTSVPPLPSARRQQFETILSNGKWLPAIEETESALKQFRFCLDLNRMTHQALTGLGESHAQAAAAVAAETASLLQRMPGLPDLTFADGSAFADADTKAWLSEFASAGGGVGGSGAGSDNGELAEALAELRGLMKSQPQEGMKLGARLIEQATSPRHRLLGRLALSEACLDAGQAKLARGMFAAIDREMRQRGLADWDPPLVGRCLEGFIRSIRAAAKAGSPYEGAEEIFERLCLVDPAAAAKLS